MEITILKDKLKEVLQIISDICSKRSDLNILNYFYLEAKDNKIYISATDLDLNYQTTFPSRIIKEGKILIPAKQFQNIIENLYEDDLTLETKDNVLFIKTKQTFSSLPGLLEEDFPTFQNINYDNYFEIDSNIFDDFVNKLYPILLTSDLRPEYSGIYFDLNNDNLNLVATDTIRLGIQLVKPQLFETNIKKINALLSKRLISEYKSIRKKSGKLKIYFEETQVTFEILNHKLTTKLSSIEYPNYKSFMSPNNFLFSFLIDKDNILKALRLSKIFSGNLREVELSFDLKNNKLTLYSKNEFLGENKNIIDFQIKDNNLVDDSFNIKFSVDFLIDGFNVNEGEKIFAGFFNGPHQDSSPIYIKSPLYDDFFYIAIHR
ncbi:MAG: hypothetical protein KatS3mg097_332 [Candidatus Parcubacteria bacterium]|nr:MAG: hypothetical protein KatS3mg097_332 [Candidatus Parcubacteria bacterium]